MRILDPCASYGIGISLLSKHECIAKDIKDFSHFYLHNKHATFYKDDLRNPKHYFKPDLIICGVSCRPFSNANTSKKYQAHSEFDLFIHLMKYIQIEKPQVVIIENVPPFKKFLPYFEKFIPKPYKLVHKNVYNYLDYGCNWNRKRLFLVLAQNNLDIDMSKYMEPSKTSYEILPYIIPFIEYKAPQSILKRYYNDKRFKSCLYCKQFLPSFGSNTHIFHESHGLLHPLQIAQLLEIPLDLSKLSLSQQMYALANAIHPKFLCKMINMVERVI